MPVSETASLWNCLILKRLEEEKIRLKEVALSQSLTISHAKEMHLD